MTPSSVLIILFLLAFVLIPCGMFVLARFLHIALTQQKPRRITLYEKLCEIDRELDNASESLGRELIPVLSKAAKSLETFDEQMAEHYRITEAEREND